MKQTTFLFVTGLFFIGALAYLIAQVFIPYVSQEEQDTNTRTSDADKQDIYQDSDGDGLPDWEERLYGTNAQRADSDGDGISDAEEIRQGGDPAAYYARNTAQLEIIEEDTEVYQFAQTNNPSSIDDARESVNTFEKSLRDQERTQASESDTSTPIKRCVNQLGGIVSDTLITTQEDSQIINQYLQGTKESTAPIEAIRDAHNQAAFALEDFDTKECPRLEQSRVRLQELYITTAELFSDILRAPQASQEQYQLWQEYATMMTEWMDMLIEVRTLTQIEEISFESHEPGYIFTHQGVQ